MDHLSPNLARTRIIVSTMTAVCSRKRTYGFVSLLRAWEKDVWRLHHSIQGLSQLILIPCSADWAPPKFGPLSGLEKINGTCGDVRF
jgi:hypothetical protein